MPLLSPCRTELRPTEPGVHRSTTEPSETVMNEAGDSGLSSTDTGDERGARGERLCASGVRRLTAIANGGLLRPSLCSLALTPTGSHSTGTSAGTP